MRSRLPLVAAMLSATLVGAQPTPEDIDPLGPVRCYLDVTRGANMTTVQAKQLCTGAADESPARCFAQARARWFTDAQAVRLCAGASSLAPATCAQALDASTGLDDHTIVSYCAALHWPLIPIDANGAPACVAGARARTGLLDFDAVRLCSGSTSTSPVDCYAWGRANTAMADQDLIDLCRPVVSVPYLPWL